jgi:hypothetical protein
VDSFAILKRNEKTGNEVQRILGLPNNNWSDVQIAFGTDEIATAKVTLLLTGDQLNELAIIAFHRNPMGSCSDDS